MADKSVDFFVHVSVSITLILPCLAMGVGILPKRHLFYGSSAAESQELLNGMLLGIVGRMGVGC